MNFSTFIKEIIFYNKYMLKKIFISDIMILSKERKQTMITNEQFLEKIKGGLIVSCQALSNEPLYNANVMGDMANAAQMGGAVGIRANTVKDICEIKAKVDLPIIGIIKEEYDDSEVFITPTMLEVDQLVECGCEVIALDATNRKRPQGIELEDFFKEVKRKYPNQLFMADCSTFSEGIKAAELGFDLIGTTLCGYTKYTKGISLPNYDLIKKLSISINSPIVAEGGIWQPEQLVKAYQSGAYTAIVGTAITRPMNITQKFVDAIASIK